MNGSTLPRPSLQREELRPTVSQVSHPYRHTLVYRRRPSRCRIFLISRRALFVFMSHIPISHRRRAPGSKCSPTGY